MNRRAVFLVSVILFAPACSTDDGGDEYSDDDAFVSTDVSQDRSRPDLDTAVADADAGDNASQDLGPTDTREPDEEDSDVSEPPVVGLSIIYDYRYDVSGVLSSDAARFTLEEAARQWGYVLHDDFDEIAAGTAIYVRNPEETSEEMNLSLDTGGLRRFEQTENQKTQKIRKGTGLVGLGRPCGSPVALSRS